MYIWEPYAVFPVFLQTAGYHIAFEFSLIMLVFWLLYPKTYKPQGTVLFEMEKEQLFEDWDYDERCPYYDYEPLHCSENVILEGKLGRRVRVNSIVCLNMVTQNFLSLAGCPTLKKGAEICLKNYSAGPFGRPRHPGNVHLHRNMEANLARFMKVEAAVLFSFCSKICGAIAAYVKQDDVIFCDSGANIALQNGIVLSGSAYHFFEHNNMQHLESLLKEQAELDELYPENARDTRRILVVEGIYLNYGDICPLPQLVKLKKKYNGILFIEESCSFGVLGDRGRGVTEHFGIPASKVDVIIGSLENAIPSYGGFCCGTKFVNDMVLCELGDGFSLTVDPLDTGFAFAALDMLMSFPYLVQKLRENCIKLHRFLLRLPKVVILGDEQSPVKHITLESSVPPKKVLANLRRIAAYALDRGIALTVACYMEKELNLPPPSIRLAVSAGLTDADIYSVFNALKKACKEIL